MFGSDGAGTKFALKGFFSCAIGGAAAAAGRGCWTECFVVAGPSPVLFAEDDAGGSGSIDLAAAGLEPRGLCRGATDVLPPVLGGSDCGCWGDITGVPGAGKNLSRKGCACRRAHIFENLESTTHCSDLPLSDCCWTEMRPAPR